MPEPTPEAWAQIRHDYEHTDRPLAHICDEHEITAPMLRYRMKKWDWTRRKPLIPREGPPAVAPSADAFLHPPLEGEGRRFERQREPAGWGDAVSLEDHPTPPAFAYASAGDPPPLFRTDGRERPFAGEGKKEAALEGEEAASIVPRLRSAVARVLPAIEATVARLASGAQHPREMEQAGRTLGSLTRALRELNALVAQYNAQPVGGSVRDDDPVPEDIDEFRNELARRIEALIAADRPAKAATPASGEQG